MGHYASEMEDGREAARMTATKKRLKKAIDKIENPDYLDKVAHILDNTETLIEVSKLITRLGK